MVNKEISEKLDELESWFKENPKLPQEIDPLLLRRFLKCMFYDVEETKKLIELNFMLRNKHPHIFLNRDPDNESTKEIQETNDLVPLPGLTPDGLKLLVYRIADYDASKMNSVEETKMFFMMADCRFSVPDKDSTENNINKTDDDGSDDEHTIANGEVQIVDIAGYSLAHVARMSISCFRIYMKFLQEAYPVRLRAMHIINCPSFLNKMIAIMKPFTRDDVYKMIHFHTTNIETLYDHVPRDMLPDEYGGKAGTLAELKQTWTQKIKEKREYLMDPKQWKVEQTENSRWSLW